MAQETVSLWADIPHDSSSNVVVHNGVMMDRRFEAFLHAQHLNSLDRLFADDLGDRIDKAGLAAWRQRRRIVLNEAGTPITLYLKRFENPPLAARRQVRRSGSGARTVAGVEWSWLRRLAEIGIACATPIALAEAFQGRRELRSVVLMQAVPGESLERWMLRWRQLDTQTRRAILMESARLVAQFHQHGYVHRDLYLSHLFFDNTAPPDKSLTLIDLQRVFRPRWRRRRWIVKDLASLNFSAPLNCISPSDRLRWLLAYLGGKKPTRTARSMAYRVMGKTASILRRSQ